MGFAVGFLAEVNRREDKADKLEYIALQHKLSMQKELVPMLRERIGKQAAIDSEVKGTVAWFSNHLQGLEEGDRNAYLNTLMRDPAQAVALKASVIKAEEKGNIVLENEGLVRFANVVKNAYDQSEFKAGGGTFDQFSNAAAVAAPVTRNNTLDIDSLWAILSDPEASMAAVNTANRQLSTPVALPSSGVAFTTRQQQKHSTTNALLGYQVDMYKTHFADEAALWQAELDRLEALDSKSTETQTARNHVNTLVGFGNTIDKSGLTPQMLQTGGQELKDRFTNQYPEAISMPGQG